MKTALVVFAASAVAIAGISGVFAADAQTPAAQPASAVMAEAHARGALRPVSDFASISDRNARSIALFEEAGKVITHPRCTNCHPVSTPSQGDERRPHMPAVSFGEAGMGAAGMPCVSCHTAKNVWVGGVQTVTVPGNPRWSLAPKEMAWQGKSLGDICRQLKDTRRNGGKTMDEMVEHMAHDDLIAWGWDPGEGRTPAPGTQAQFGELIKAWVDTGAACPSGGPVVPSHDLPTE